MSHPLIEAIRPHASAIAGPLSKTAFERGLAVTAKDTGARRPIPVTATPMVVSAAELERAVRLSRLLSSGAVKMARAVVAGPMRELLLGALSPVERRLADRTATELRRLVTTRVDFFIAEKPWALEVNATIPAMQAYSDIAAGAFLEAVGARAGLSPSRIAELGRMNGSNTEALYEALLRGYALERKGARPNRILLLCRRNDAQLSEQLYLAKRFTQLGTEAEVVHPDELSGEDAVRARGKTFDLVYRHLFARRLDETPNPYVERLFAEAPSSPRVVVLNPPASQVEAKATFALLSRAITDPELAAVAGLDADELAAIADGVPWTRPFHRGRTIDPDGNWVDDLVEYVAANPAEFVLKRSWDYGGKTVFVGGSLHEAGFQERVKGAYGVELSWPDLCRRAAEDPVGGGFVVQRLVRAVAQKHLLCVDDGVREVELYVDFSAYASVGLDAQPRWGGVCRGSVSRIVNILGGGGVLPLVTEEVADVLAAALRTR